MAITITGVSASIRWAHPKGPLAVTLGEWTVKKEPEGVTVTASAKKVDLFVSSQRPLLFLTENGWSWPITSLQIEGVSLTATLGPGEKSHEQPLPVRHA